MVRRTNRSSDFRTDWQRRSPIPWFTPEAYDLIITVIDDPLNLPHAYDQWHEIAQRKKRDFQRRGRFAVPVNIDFDEFLAWCAGKGVEASMRALDDFAYQRITPELER